MESNENSVGTPTEFSRDKSNIVIVETFKWTDQSEKRKKLRDASCTNTTELVKNVPELLDVFDIGLLGALSSTKYTEQKHGSHTTSKAWIMLNTGPKRITLEMSTDADSNWVCRGLSGMYRSKSEPNELLIISVPAGFGVVMANSVAPIKVMWEIKFTSASSKSTWWILESFPPRMVPNHDAYAVLAWCATQQYFVLVNE